MSGGHWNYQNDRLKTELFGYWNDDKFNPKYHNIVEDIKLSALIFDVFELLHDYDWYASGDYCEETWIESKKKFKDKWFKSNPGLDEELIDSYLAVVKEDIMKSLDLPSDPGGRYEN